MYELTTRKQNLLNAVPHDTDGTTLYTFHHEGRWFSTTCTPVIIGKDELNRPLVEIQVEAVYDDVATMLQAHRENGYHSWKMHPLREV